MMPLSPSRYRSGVVDRNITPANYLDRLPRVEPIPGHAWESVQGYTMQELQTLERMLKSEITHYQQGLANGDLQTPHRVAAAIKLKRQDQLSAVRAIRQVRFPHGNSPSRPNQQKNTAKMVWHLARMFHRWVETHDDGDWDEVIAAYERIPTSELDWTSSEQRDVEASA